MRLTKMNTYQAVSRAMDFNSNKNHIADLPFRYYYKYVYAHLGYDLTKQPYFEGKDYRVAGELTNTNITMNGTYWIGIYPALDAEHFSFVAENLEEFFGLNF